MATTGKQRLQPWQRALGARASVADVVRYLHDNGVGILDSIKIVRSGFSLTLIEAKKLVSTQPCWRATVEGTQRDWDELEKVLD